MPPPSQPAASQGRSSPLAQCFVGGPSEQGQGDVDGAALSGGDFDGGGHAGGQRSPGDLDGWVLLGRSYVATGRYGAAAEALSRAATLAPDDADLAASWGEALVHAAGLAAPNSARRAIDMAAEIGAPVLVLIAGGLAEGSRDLAAAHSMVEDGVAAVLPHARAAGVRLALEPLHPMYAADRACVNSLGHALDVCDRLGDSMLGVAVDVYHVWWDPDLERQVARAGASRLFGFHVCDWLVPTRDLLLDRGMMGDGVVDVPRIRRWMDAAGYAGPIEVEIFSAENWWRRDPAEVVAIAKRRFADCV